MTEALKPGAGTEQPFDGSGPRSGPPDALVLDIGGDIGALVVYADEACLGAEIDVTPVGAPRGHRIHTMVRRRRATGKDVIAGLYPELREGTYTIWGLDDGGPIGEVTVTGAWVSEFHAGNCRGPAGTGQDGHGPPHSEHHDHT